eukprot:TRINITY_DN2207_c0_g1_i1.p1 TRINITY_DN2207_c0_g1~~TRINITY_DN2207_c0_g1_i1.p1  ORF type:complete len:227 (-),score=29.40 TRINITY_DN2207_c0_g1_i1:44-724(-)
MPTGTVVRWHSDKGFGFIKPHDGGSDVFCHSSGLLDGDGSVLDGDEVRFQIKFDDRANKDRAVEVEVTGGGGRARRKSSRSRSPPRRGGGGDRRSGGGDRERGGPGTGKLLRWNADKGFGFIQTDDGGEDLFCHVSDLLDGDGSVRDGDQVSYIKVLHQANGKWRAVDVARAGGRGGGGGRRGRDSRSPPPPRRGGGGRDSRSPPPRRGGGGGRRCESRSPPRGRR